MTVRPMEDPGGAAPEELIIDPASGRYADPEDANIQFEADDTQFYAEETGDRPAPAPPPPPRRREQGLLEASGEFLGRLPARAEAWRQQAMDFERRTLDPANWRPAILDEPGWGGPGTAAARRLSSYGRGLLFASPEEGASPEELRAHTAGQGIGAALGVVSPSLGAGAARGLGALGAGRFLRGAGSVAGMAAEGGLLGAASAAAGGGDPLAGAGVGTAVGGGLGAAGTVAGGLLGAAGRRAAERADRARLQAVGIRYPAAQKELERYPGGEAAAAELLRSRAIGGRFPTPESSREGIEALLEEGSAASSGIRGDVEARAAREAAAAEEAVMAPAPGQFRMMPPAPPPTGQDIIGTAPGGRPRSQRDTVPELGVTAGDTVAERADTFPGGVVDVTEPMPGGPAMEWPRDITERALAAQQEVRRRSPLLRDIAQVERREAARRFRVDTAELVRTIRRRAADLEALGPAEAGGRSRAILEEASRLEERYPEGIPLPAAQEIRRSYADPAAFHRGLTERASLPQREARRLYGMLSERMEAAAEVAGRGPQYRQAQEEAQLGITALRGADVTARHVEGPGLLRMMGGIGIAAGRGDVPGVVMGAAYPEMVRQRASLGPGIAAETYDAINRLNARNPRMRATSQRLGTALRRSGVVGLSSALVSEARTSPELRRALREREEEGPADAGQEGAQP